MQVMTPLYQPPVDGFHGTSSSSTPREEMAPLRDLTPHHTTSDYTLTSLVDSVGIMSFGSIDEEVHEHLESDRGDPIYSSDQLESLMAESPPTSQLRLGLHTALSVFSWVTSKSSARSAAGKISDRSMECVVNVDDFDRHTMEYVESAEPTGLPRPSASRHLLPSPATSRRDVSNALFQRSVRDLYQRATSRQNSVGSRCGVSIIVSSRGGLFLETTPETGVGIGQFNCSALSLDVEPVAPTSPVATAAADAPPLPSRTNSTLSIMELSTQEFELLRDASLQSILPDISLDGMDVAEPSTDETYYKLTWKDAPEPTARTTNDWKDVDTVTVHPPFKPIPAPRPFADVDCSTLGATTAGATGGAVPVNPPPFQVPTESVTPVSHRTYIAVESIPPATFHNEICCEGLLEHSVASNLQRIPPPPTHYNDVHYEGVDEMVATVPANPPLYQAEMSDDSDTSWTDENLTHHGRPIPPPVPYNDLDWTGSTQEANSSSSLIPENPTFAADSLEANDRDVVFADVSEQSPPGTQVYYDQIERRQSTYAASTEREKLTIRQDLIRMVRDRGGRFLKCKTTNAVSRLVEIKDKPLHTQIKDDLHVKNYIGDSATDLDFIVGRGGHGQSHPGNQAYLNQKDTLRQSYIDAKGPGSKDRKHQISKDLVHWLQNRGGRFLTKDRHGKWYILSDETAYEQAKQKLNEPRKLNST